MLRDPQQKYRPFPSVGLTDRTWPDRVLTAPPIWLSTDLRDGNQALFEPMDGARKYEMFTLLCRLGFKEIEVGFPSASQTDFDFVRRLIEDNLIPEDVTIGVLTPARIDLVERTVESVRGARRAIVHLYNAISPLFRTVVFERDRAGVVDMAVRATRAIQDLTVADTRTEWVFQYSPETFSGAELDFAKEICDAVVETWNPRDGESVIINLPATVEMATPNIFADQIEWMHRHLARRTEVILSIHPHNDRGTGIAAAELALAAGAQRVEGCLFGNGERTGNVDLVTLALNLYSQGISPGLDFSRIDEVARVVEQCTRLPLSPRHPYVGDLVFTAFSGSHQDAIKKGLAAQKPDRPWNVPYLPLDPADVGRSYDAIIRVNSQSGKGGVAYLLETHYQMVLPRRLQIELSQVVKQETDTLGGEMTAQALWALFSRTYLVDHSELHYIGHRLEGPDNDQTIQLMVRWHGQKRILVGRGNGPLDAALRALEVPVHLRLYEERSLGREASAEAVAFVELHDAIANRTAFGVAINANIVTASLVALVRALARIQVPRGASVQRGHEDSVCTPSLVKMT